MCLHVRTCTLTTPSPASPHSLPRPHPCTPLLFGCVSHTMQGVLCCEGRLRALAQEQQKEVHLVQARVGAPRPPPHAPALATKTPQQTIRHQITRAKCEKGHSAAAAGQGHPAQLHRLPRRNHRLDSRKKCSFKSTLPYATKMCPHTNLAVSETSQLKEPYGLTQMVLTRYPQRVLSTNYVLRLTAQPARHCCLREKFHPKAKEGWGTAEQYCIARV